MTGVEGYIGCLLAPILLRRGYEVVGLDTGFYRDGWLYSDRNLFPVFPTLINKDLRHATEEDLSGAEAVVHLAELSNDPLGENSPDITKEINHGGSLRLAKLAKGLGIERFVYTSSCSVYGISDADRVTEESPVNPQTTYAECKVAVETDLGAMASDDFSPTFLRNATAYGASPRMRFDIVLNNLAGLAWTTGKIAMTSDGTPWRPLVHVLDICHAILAALEAPRERIHNQVFNVGDTKANYQIREIAEIVGDVFPDCEVTMGPSGGDDRSYRVSFDKIRDQLPEFRCAWDARRGAEQLYEAFKRIDMTGERFQAPPFTRLQQLRYLLGTGQIDESFFWKA